MQIDGETFSEMIVFQVTSWQPEDLHPLPDWGRLPRQLHPWSAVYLGRNKVRLAFESPEDLWVRLDIEPTAETPLELGVPDVQSADSSVGRILWSAHSEYGWPERAVWDDGSYRYDFSVLLQGAGPDAWSWDDLLT
ncbi:MAG: hypothetical protein ACREX3_25775, partial [Gammaproteobacteria bacterium]